MGIGRGFAAPLNILQAWNKEFLFLVGDAGNMIITFLFLSYGKSFFLFSKKFMMWREIIAREYRCNVVMEDTRSLLNCVITLIKVLGCEGIRWQSFKGFSKVFLCKGGLNRIHSRELPIKDEKLKDEVKMSCQYQCSVQTFNKYPD